MRLRVIGLAALLVVLPACAQRDHGVDLGLKRVTLDLSFKAKGGAPPTLRQIIDAQEPFGPATQAVGNAAAPVLPPGGLSLAGCPVARAGLVPETPVDGVPIKGPEAGLYLQHVTGTYDLSGALSLKGNFFPYSTMTIANVVEKEGTDQLGQEKHTVDYDVVEQNYLSTTTTHYQSITRDVSRTEVKNSPQAIASELEMDWVKTATNGGGTQTFTPSPPITMMQYGGEGAQWTSAGIDQVTGTSMVVQGTISKREPVDVCGKVVDTFRVESTERVANPDTGYSSQTNSSTGNVYNVATQFGGLMVRKTIDTTTAFTVSGAQETLVVKSTSTVDSVTPASKPKA